MMVDRYSSLKEEVGGSIPDCEISSLLDINMLGGQFPHVRAGLSSQNKIKIVVDINCYPQVYASG